MVNDQIMELKDDETDKLMDIVEDVKRKTAKGVKDLKADPKKLKEPEKASGETPEEAEARITKIRTEALRDFMNKAEKDFGSGAVMRWGEKVSNVSVSVVPTGCLGVDLALGIGGVPRGRIIEIYGPESSGKTTLTLHIVAEVQKMRGVAAFIDAEHALDPVYARKLGVNIDDLYISQPDSGDQALEIAEAMVKSGAIDLIVIDSVAALVPKAEIENGEVGQATMGMHARLMSAGLRRLTAICGRTGTIIIFTNQLRTNIGGYGSPDVTTGGRALKFYASIRLDIRGTGKPIMEGDRAMGRLTKVKVAKNKLSPPFKECQFDIMFGQGIAYEGDLINVGVEADVVKKSGAFYYYKDQRLGQGYDKAKAFLKENPEMAVEIENEVRKSCGMKSLTEIRSAPLREVVAIDAKPKKDKKGKAKSEKADVEIAEIGPAASTGGDEGDDFASLED